MPSSDRNLNFAVIGLGKLGLLHAALVNALPGSRLAAVVDTSSFVLDALRSHVNDVRTYSDYTALLKDGGIDAVAIATPTHLHVPIAVHCVDAGLHVFIEKPLSISAAQAQPLLQALRGRPVANAVGYMGRHIDTFRKAKEIVSTGALGRLQMLRSSMYIGQLFRTGKGWRYDKASSGGGVLITQNAHVVDKLLWMFGDIQEVSGHIASLYSTTVEDHCHAVFRFRSGLLGYMDASWSARHYRTPTISIHVQGENGTLDVDDDSVRLFLEEARPQLPAGWSTWRKPDLYRGVTIDVGGPQYTTQLEEFLAAIRSGTPISSDVASAVRTQAVIEAVYESARAHGAPVKPSDLISRDQHAPGRAVQQLVS
jgi:predicted dehydrogenase